MKIALAYYMRFFYFYFTDLEYCHLLYFSFSLKNEIVPIVYPTTPKFKTMQPSVVTTRKYPTYSLVGASDQKSVNVKSQ